MSLRERVRDERNERIDLFLELIWAGKSKEADRIFWHRTSKGGKE